MRHPHALPLQPLQPLFLLPPSLLAARNRAMNRALEANPSKGAADDSTNVIRVSEARRDESLPVSPSPLLSDRPQVMGSRVRLAAAARNEPLVPRSRREPASCETAPAPACDVSANISFPGVPPSANRTRGSRISRAGNQMRRTLAAASTSPHFPSSCRFQWRSWGRSLERSS
jgi:hypothetical protein